VQLDVPYPIALGLFVALLDVVPLVGATSGAVVSSTMAFTVSAGTGIAAIAFFVVYQQFENFVLVPRVIRRAVDVSPAATIVAILVGGALLGVVGALLAVPTAAAIQLVCTEVVLPRQEAA
jgi:predicted PurR-regulated permease PerM